VSDHCGEKLSERFVERVLRDLAATRNLTLDFGMLAPDVLPSGTAYTLYLEAKGTAPSQTELHELAGDLDKRLRTGFHYDVCRRLGQLGPAQVVAVSDGEAQYLSGCCARGQRLGDVKPTALASATGWRDWFTRDGAGGASR
jgi:hypothetical protein